MFWGPGMVYSHGLLGCLCELIIDKIGAGNVTKRGQMWIKLDQKKENIKTNSRLFSYRTQAINKHVKTGFLITFTYPDVNILPDHGNLFGGYNVVRLNVFL